MRQEPFFGKTHFFTFFNEPCEEQSLCNPLCPRPWPLGGRFYLIKERLSSGSIVSLLAQEIKSWLLNCSPVPQYESTYYCPVIKQSWTLKMLEFFLFHICVGLFSCFSFVVLYLSLIQLICCWGYTKFWGSHNSFAWL